MVPWKNPSLNKEIRSQILPIAGVQSGLSAGSSTRGGGGSRHGHQLHLRTTDRTRARVILDNLWMHRTSPYLIRIGYPLLGLRGTSCGGIWRSLSGQNQQKKATKKSEDFHESNLKLCLNSSCLILQRPFSVVPAQKE